jgi:glycosyltransferase involved in cell wall biosynthesis
VNQTSLTRRGVLQGEKTGRNIAIFFWEGYLGVAPSMINCIRVFSEAGYEVDVITRYAGYEYAQPPRFPANVRILFFPLSHSPRAKQDGVDTSLDSIPQSKTFRIRELLPSPLRRVLRKWVDDMHFILERLQFIRFGLRFLEKRHYACLIGVDTEGLISATAVGLLKKVPVLYWSLEITFLNDLNDWKKRMFKRLERICHRKALLTIIQDEERAQSLMTENGVNSEVAIVPNGPLGPRPQISSDHFQRKFDIPSSQRIILHTGMINPAALSLELASVASTWPDTWTLILHERVKREPSHPYLKRVQKAGDDRVRLSLDPVPYDELDFLISSGHIGIVAYDKKLGPNFSLMTTASGKLGHYLRCGLPVVCIDLPGLSETMSKYHCGLVVEDLQDVGQAIESIFRHYDFYEANAVKCYEEVYEFSVHFRQVLHVTETLNSRRKRSDSKWSS